MPALPYQTQVPLGVWILVHRQWHWLLIHEDSVPLDRILSDLEKLLSGAQMTVAKKFVLTARGSGQRPFTTLLVRDGTSRRLEVFSSELSRWDIWRSRALAKKHHYPCGSYNPGNGRVMWVSFD
jgi:hypothetical protein